MNVDKNQHFWTILSSDLGDLKKGSVDFLQNLCGQASNLLFVV